MYSLKEVKMAVKIRLQRAGTKGIPHFKIVAIDGKAPRDGRAIETLGYYNPQNEPSVITIDKQRIFNWASRGAIITKAVWTLLKKQGVTRKDLNKAVKKS
jgi:small subunit ribosomal protein S16